MAKKSKEQLLTEKAELENKLAEVIANIQSQLTIGDKVSYEKRLVSGRIVILTGKIINVNLTKTGKVATLQVELEDSFYEGTAVVNKQPKSLTLIKVGK